MHGRCDCVVCLWVGLSKRFPVLTVSVTQLCTFTHACFLDSEASAQLGEAEISDDAECFGSPQAFMDDCETHSDCLIDGQCKPPSSDRPDTCNPPSLSTHSDTDHNPSHNLKFSDTDHNHKSTPTLSHGLSGIGCGISGSLGLLHLWVAHVAQLVMVSSIWAFMLGQKMMSCALHLHMSAPRCDECMSTLRRRQ